MKLRYLGTAAAEGLPAIFCDCPTCREARKRGGRDLRTRTQALINDDLLIDYPADTLAHAQTYGLDLQNVADCLITHVHEDHLYPIELRMLRTQFFCHPHEGFHLTFHGSMDTVEAMKDNAAYTDGTVSVEYNKPFVPFTAGRYTVTPLKAWHGTDHPYIYLISDGEKTILYGHDTDVFPDETWAYLAKAKPHLDLVSLDCTDGAREEMSYHGHMCIGRNRECKNRLLSLGLADEKTVFVINHFSHNGLNVLYDDLRSAAEKDHFVVSYDGLEISL